MITGILAGKGLLWVAFVVAGALMCVYDMGIWLLFGRLESRARDVAGSNREKDEESNISDRSEEVIMRVPSTVAEREECEVQQILGGDEKPPLVIQGEEEEKEKAQNKLEAT